MNTFAGVAVLAAMATAVGANAAFPVACERAWLAVANAITFDWYRRLQERADRHGRSEFVGLAAMLDDAGLHEQARKVREIP